MVLTLSGYIFGRMKPKNVFKHAQNARFQSAQNAQILITLHMRKVPSRLRFSHILSSNNPMTLLADSEGPGLRSLE